MAWWSRFDRDEVRRDVARVAAAGMDSVRLFLLWEAFQPSPDRVDHEVLARLVEVADIADAAGVRIMPTLCTGHMSGVNWIPGWALGGSHRDRRFRVVSGGRVVADGLRDWFTDGDIGRAQALLAHEAAAALAGHPALWAWDLGNEHSNCVVPPDRERARRWLGQMTAAIRSADPAALVTIGLHMEDLEQDRRLGPREAAEVCDLLTMHGYPIYATWADGPLDPHLVPFLACITRWLGGGADVLFSEFGLPTVAAGGAAGPVDGPALVPEARRRHLHRAGARRAPCGRVRGGDALVLRRLRPGHLGRPAARRGTARAHVRSVALRRHAEARRRRGRRVRRPGPGRAAPERLDRCRPARLLARAERSPRPSVPALPRANAAGRLTWTQAATESTPEHASARPADGADARPPRWIASSVRHTPAAPRRKTWETTPRTSSETRTWSPTAPARGPPPKPDRTTADGTDADGTDADGTDGTDADGTDGDATDTTDGDGTDADGTDTASS